MRSAANVRIGDSRFCATRLWALGYFCETYGEEMIDSALPLCEYLGYFCETYGEEMIDSSLPVCECLGNENEM